jgi:hypothetical protein
LQEILIVEQGKFDNLVVGTFGEEVINDNGDKLIDICEQNFLKVLNGYFQHKKKYIITHGTKIHSS